ncbi:glycosyltransferase, partial [Acidisphaera rubrifaciens]|uniref:glycosyltransferase n=1 Tax=Acidisphaera rubrifaciens TaxID=50715 RepID=UPI000662A6CE
APLGARVAWCDADALPAALARAVAVLLPQQGDQDGIAALEAMRAGRAVVTCTDTDAAAELVVDGATGLVRAPDAAALAAALDALWDDRQGALRMGQAARDAYDALHLRWEAVTSRLLAR